MIRVDKDLISKEIEKDGFRYHKLKLSNKFIDSLFNHYYCHEMVENFYDSEPDFDGKYEELYNMYLDYSNMIEVTGLTFWNVVSRIDELKDTHKFSKENHTIEELKDAYLKVKKMYEDYEERRMIFCNWQEPYLKGNWGMSQKYVDSYAREIMKDFQKLNIAHNGRFFIAKNDEQIRIYIYSRDFKKVDYWFIFMKRKKRLR